VDGVEYWIDRLGYDAAPGAVVRRREGCSAGRPFAPEMKAIFDEGRETHADAFVCVDRVPTIALVDRLSLPRDDAEYGAALRRFCETLWNQSLVRIVLVASSNQLEAWAVDNPKVAPELVGNKDGTDLPAWTLSGILGGEILRSRDTWFKAEARVDRVLLDSILFLIAKLRGDGLHPSVARELIARIIFVSYLEDRGIIGDHYRDSRAVKPLYDLLGEEDAAGLESLFTHLQEDFHGDFIQPVTDPAGFWHRVPPSALADLHAFLGRTVLRSQQKDFWRYDFSEIPIELIAGVYETFLTSKDDDEFWDLSPQPPRPAYGRAKRSQGAYYTPRVLAEAVVDLAFAGRDGLDDRIFDGACGSGMLLTAAYRRLIRANHAEAERLGLGDEACGFIARKNLLTERIFGADIDENACQLTSFSLYLALLSDLTPRDLQILQDGGHKLPPLGSNIRRGPRDGNFLSRESEQRNRKRFTMVLSNPPWRRLRAGDAAVEAMQDWVGRLGTPAPHIPRQEIAAAFAISAADWLEDDGRATLILPVSLFLSSERTIREFRGDLLGRFRFENIVNFADMRYLIFADARHPFVVITARARPVERRYGSIASETFSYLTPKTDIALAFDRLSLHESDAIRLPASALIDETPHLQLRYWGGELDLALLRRLWQHGRIADLLEPDGGWFDGKGFHLQDNDRRRPPATWSVPAPAWMLENPFLDAKRLTRNLPIVEKRALRPFPFERIARVPGELRLFNGPRVLWPDGANPATGGVNAVYADGSFSYQHSIGILSAPRHEVGRLTARFLATFMRSSLGAWLSILLSPSVSAERAKLHIAELSNWPFWTPSAHPAPERAIKVLGEVDALMKRIEDEFELLANATYEALRPKLDELVFDYFGLREEERAIVLELVAVARTSIQPSGLRHGSMVEPLRVPPTREHIDRYLTRLAATFRKWRDATGGSGEVRTYAWTARRVPLGAAVIALAEDEAEKHEGRLEDDGILDDIAAAMKRVSTTTPASLFGIPNLTIIDGSRIIVLKPLIARYWLERAAVEDASRIAADIQAMQSSAGTELSSPLGERPGE
jgi:hypothetical protein